MTYRERREAKAARLREWAEKREQKADALLERRKPFEGDTAFWTQPGRLPERDRIHAATERAWENQIKADNMNLRASGIEDQLDHSIYSDDPDAIEALTEKIATLEAKRDRIKVVNGQLRAAAKKGDEATKDVLRSLSDTERADLLSLATCQGYLDPLHKGYPSYALTNLGGNIRRYQQRLADLAKIDAQRQGEGEGETINPPTMTPWPQSPELIKMLPTPHRITKEQGARLIHEYGTGE